MTMQGGCLCGAIRYQCSQKPILQFNCHCRDCQKSSGGPYVPIAFFAMESVTISGEPRYFQSLGRSGKAIRRGFCPYCGSRLFGLLDIMPAQIAISAGTLDDPAMFRPRANLFASYAAPWDHLDSTLTTFADNAPQGA